MHQSKTYVFNCESTTTRNKSECTVGPDVKTQNQNIDRVKTGKH